MTDTTKLKPIHIVEVEQQKENDFHSVDRQQVFVSFNCNPLSWGTDEAVTILHFVPTADNVAYDPQQALRDIDQLQLANEECEHKFDQYGVYRCTFRIEYVKSGDYFSSGDDVDELYHFEDGELMFAFDVTPFEEIDLLANVTQKFDYRETQLEELHPKMIVYQKSAIKRLNDKQQ